MTSEQTLIWTWTKRTCVAIIVCVVLFLWGCPNYAVYQQNLVGKAELKRAEQNRQIVIQEAQAKKESAQFLAESEIIRAKGVAEANKIIGESLKGNDAYLRYLWIDKLSDEGQIIYVPTEAGLPILEANRFTQDSKQQPK